MSASARRFRGAKLEPAPELGDDVQVVVGSSHDGARDVHVDSGSAGGSGPGLDPRSAATRPCQ